MVDTSAVLYRVRRYCSSYLECRFKKKTPTRTGASSPDVIECHSRTPPLPGGAEYTNCISARTKTPPTSVLDMTLNNWMMSFQ